MSFAVTEPGSRVVPRASGLAVLRPHELIAAAYFTALALMAGVRGRPASDLALLMLVPAGICALCAAETWHSRRWSSAVRDWGSLALILVAYFSLGMFASPPATHWESRLQTWDQFLLHKVGFFHVIEAAGPLAPFTLETVYLLLYAFPTTGLAFVQAEHSRTAVRQYLTVLFLGTFSAYLLLPLFPVLSPRIAFPGADLPAFEGFTRHWNVWLLDHYDNSPGVFPSGHVAVAFSCAYGLLAAIPQRRSVWIGAFILAFGVYLATIYGRYHYAVDGLASICIATTAWLIVRNRRDKFSTSVWFSDQMKQF